MKAILSVFPLLSSSEGSDSRSMDIRAIVAIFMWILTVDYWVFTAELMLDVIMFARFP